MAAGTGRAGSLSGYRVIWCADALGLAEVGPVCIALWQRDVTIERFRRQERALAEVVQRYPWRSGFLCVVEPETVPPDQRLRAESAEMINSHNRRLKYVVSVIEGEGFRSAVTRHVLTAIARIAGHRDAKFMATVDAAAAWLGPRCGVEQPTQIVHACKFMRMELSSSSRRAQ